MVLDNMLAAHIHSFIHQKIYIVPLKETTQKH